jgi:AcrR family transcriptional regulator
MKLSSALPFAFPDARLRRRIRQRKQPSQERSRATTDALLEATLQVLVKEGYQALTTTLVARRAGVSVGTVYQYFPDKQSLVTALKVRYFGLMMQAMTGALAEAPADDLEALVRRALGALLTVKREHFALTRALREPMAEQSGHAFLRETMQHFTALLVPPIRRARPTLAHPERRVAVLVAAMEGAISAAVYDSPDWLGEAWFLDELVAMGLGFLERLRD